MRTVVVFIYIFFIFTSNIISAQSSDNNNIFNTENTPDSLLFISYLDSIGKYLVVDVEKVKDYKKKCEQMLDQRKQISNRLHFDFILMQIYFLSDQSQDIECLKMIEANKKMLTLDDVPIEAKNDYKYMEGYTSMVLGNIEFAQKCYYELLEYGESNNDTIAMLQSLFSLGQLYLEQEDFENAEKYYLKHYRTEKENQRIDPRRKIQINIELAELYLRKKDFKQACYYNERGLKQIDSLQSYPLQIDFLLQKGNIALKKKNILFAQKAYDEANVLSKKRNNPALEASCQFLLAHIYDEQNEYQKALKIYEDLIKNESPEMLTNLEELYEEAHQVAYKNNNLEKSYDYLKKFNEIKDSLAFQEQTQKTAYLKIKFAAEQKDKENEILTAQIQKKQSQNKFLYALASIALLCAGFLYIAFSQKRRYNKGLRGEVKNRTTELEKANQLLSKSNEELNQFNKILSHDLKEPLRSIVGFSSLANKEVGENSRLEEYLNYINKSGKQLHQLIEDVSAFQKIGKNNSDDLKMVDTQNMINSILESIQSMLIQKRARVKFEDLPPIYANSSLLFLVFKNLIENGIKYNQSTPPIITISYEQKNNQHCFLFEDNGIGIAPQFHEKVFGMFKRLHPRGVYEGSGLGLNIVKKLMDKVEGNVCIAHSEEGKGSTFELSFPILDKEHVESHTFNMSISDSN